MQIVANKGAQWLAAVMLLKIRHVRDLQDGLEVLAQELLPLRHERGVEVPERPLRWELDALHVIPELLPKRDVEIIEFAVPPPLLEARHRFLQITATAEADLSEHDVEGGGGYVCAGLWEWSAAGQALAGW